MEMSASKPVPEDEEEDIEETELEKKMTLYNRAEGYQLLKVAFDFFYNMDWIGYGTETKINSGRRNDTF